MQYISVELIALLEAGVYNFSQGISKTLMKFQFSFAVFLAMSNKFERAYMMYVWAYVMYKKALFFMWIFYWGGQKAVVECLFVALNKGWIPLNHSFG